MRSIIYSGAGAARCLASVDHPQMRKYCRESRCDIPICVHRTASTRPPLHYVRAATGLAKSILCMRGHIPVHSCTARRCGVVSREDKSVHD